MSAVSQFLAKRTLVAFLGGTVLVSGATGGTLLAIQQTTDGPPSVAVIVEIDPYRANISDEVWLDIRTHTMGGRHTTDRDVGLIAIVVYMKDTAGNDRVEVHQMSDGPLFAGQTYEWRQPVHESIVEIVRSDVLAIDALFDAPPPPPPPTYVPIDPGA